MKKNITIFAAQLCHNSSKAAVIFKELMFRRMNLKNNDDEHDGRHFFQNKRKQ